MVDLLHCITADSPLKLIEVHYSIFSYQFLNFEVLVCRLLGYMITLTCASLILHCYCYMAVYLTLLYQLPSPSLSASPLTYLFFVWLRICFWQLEYFKHIQNLHVTATIVLILQLEVVKIKVKASQSKEEAESLKFTEKHLINKVHIQVSDMNISNASISRHCECEMNICLNFV